MRLNYLHCHDPGHPAYHRDVKSANIALTGNYLAKLIDCGLAKYAPSAEGRAIDMSIAPTKTGQFQLLGTPGYMCPHYGLRSFVYDAKAEIFSFGIVMAELLVGKLQSSKQSNGVAIALDYDLEDIPASPCWPPAIAIALRELVQVSIERHSKRVDSMEHVLRILTEIKSLPINDDSVLRVKNSIVKAKETIAADYTKECNVCFMHFTAEQGIECSVHHFFCDACFSGDSLQHQLSASYRPQFAKHNCDLCCQWCLPTVNKFSDKDVFNHLDDAATAKYRAARDEVMEVKGYNLAESVFAERMKSLQLDSLNQQTTLKRVEKHRAHIAENILTLHCLSCNAVIYDFEGCFAIVCGKCEQEFCGWCLQIFPKKKCHGHVAFCDKNPHKGEVFATLEEFNKGHAKRRKQEVIVYIRDVVTSEDQAQVITAILIDLKDLTIELSDVDLQRPDEDSIKEHAQYIIDHILSLICAECDSLVEEGFQGNGAIKCKKCKKDFCGWCLKLFSEKQCMQHVSTCKKNPHRAAKLAAVIIPTLGEYNTSHAERRAEEVLAYLRDVVPENERMAVKRAVQLETENVYIYIYNSSISFVFDVEFVGRILLFFQNTVRTKYLL